MRLKPGCFARTPYGRGRVVRAWRMAGGGWIATVKLDAKVKVPRGWLEHVDITI